MKVHAATVRPVLGGMAALKAMAVPAAGKVQPLVTGAPAASCTRTLHCTKPDNHPGETSAVASCPSWRRRSVLQMYTWAEVPEQQ